MAKWLIITFSGIALSCAHQNASPDYPKEIVQTMLGIPIAKYRQNQNYNGFAAYRGWGKIYDNYFSVAHGEGRMNDVKMYLLLGFVAQMRRQAATSEAFCSDLHSVFVKHSNTVLSALQQNPYLIPSTCYYLGKFFGFESRNVAKKKPFMKTYAAALRTMLKRKGFNVCWAQIISPKHPCFSCTSP